MFSIPFWLSLLIGFLSLSEEIVWVRTVGFAYQTVPPAFSFVLVCYLVGIALGAAVGKRICGRVMNLYAAASLLLGAAALVDVLTPVFIARVMIGVDSDPGLPAAMIVLNAGLKGTLFPIVHHLGSMGQGSRVGRSMSRIYFANILGATAGPLLTGFVALDYLNVDECFEISAAACLLASVVCALKGAKPAALLATAIAAVLSSLTASWLVLPRPGSLVTFAANGRSMTHFIANRHGVVHTSATPHGDSVFGGNVYDGVASIDVDGNRNRLERLYLLALAHPHPRRVLFVGLSTGAWVRAVQGVPGVESIDVVEINPAYIELIRDYYPQLAPLLQDPRIHIHIDDGRRWLRRNPETRFDAVIQNTTFHWRANAGNLLSREYFTEVRRHMNAGAIILANTTGSYDVLATAQAVFTYAYRYSNFVYASDQPLLLDVGRLGAVRRPDGNFFTLEGATPGSVAGLLGQATLEPVDDFLARQHAKAAVITDDNVLSEYAHGRRFGPELLRALAPPEPAHFDAIAPPSPR
jgi:spermidine synthase